MSLTPHAVRRAETPVSGSSLPAISISTASSAASLFISRARAAQMLDVSVQTIDKLIKEGILPSIHVGRAVRIKVDAFNRYTEGRIQ